MAQKRGAGRGSKTVSSGSKDSVELGRNGEYNPAKKPSPEAEGVEGSQSTSSRQAEEEEEESEEESTELGRNGEYRPAKKPSPEAEGVEGSQSTSLRQAKKVPPSQEEEDEEEEKESEEESTEAPGPDPQLKRKRASSRVSRSQRRKLPPPPAAQQQGKEGLQPSESKKHKSKKVNAAPAIQQQLSESEMPKSKKITPAPTPTPLQQQGEERAQPSEPETPKSKRIRRIWTPSDEVQILKALIKHRRRQGKLPAPDNNDFYDSIAKRLEDKTCSRRIIKEKSRSLMRRYKSYVAPTTDHERRLVDLSRRVWGDLPATHAANGNNGDGEQDEGEHAMAEAENGGGQNVDKSFEEMCEMYPLLGQEVKRLVGVQPALTSSFTGLDGKRALLMEKKLDKLKWKELKIQAEMEVKVEAPKARIRKQLVSCLSEVFKNV